MLLDRSGQLLLEVCLFLLREFRGSGTGSVANHGVDEVLPLRAGYVRVSSCEYPGHHLYHHSEAPG